MNVFNEFEVGSAAAVATVREQARDARRGICEAGDGIARGCSINRR